MKNRPTNQITVQPTNRQDPREVTLTTNNNYISKLLIFKWCTQFLIFRDGEKENLFTFKNVISI